MIVYKTPDSVKKNSKFTYCPGCDHGIATKLVAEIIDELNLKNKAICVTSSGCSVFLYNFLDIDCVEAPHGRACAVATGVKRASKAIHKDQFVMTYQGDGDFASIGLGESLHCALRGENICAICINNTNYGMTGGQMGPTSILGQKTSTSPNGRNIEYNGYPIKSAEQIALCDGTIFSARVALNNIKNIAFAKNCIKKAFQNQNRGFGFSFVEILATCPTNWHLSPVEAHSAIDRLIEVYPLGVIKDV